MSEQLYICEFSHPTTWKHIFETIITHLGPKFYDWDAGLGFELDETVLVIKHRNGRKKRVLLHDIKVTQPCVAGGWFTVLREAKKKAGISE